MARLMAGHAQAEGLCYGRRKMRFFVCGAVLCVLAACGRAPDGRLITIAVNAGTEGDALKAAAREWGGAHAVRVEIIDLPYANLFEKELLDLTSRTGAYDVIMMDDPWFPRLAEGGNLTAFENLDDDFLESCRKASRHPYGAGPYYAWPYVGNSQLFFYRKDLFDKYGLGPPGTWQEVLDDARRIGGAEKMYGYVMRAAKGNAVMADFMTLFWAFGAEMFDADRRAAVASPEGIEALKFMLELGKVSPPGYAGFNADEVSAHLLQSTAVMSINWPSWIAAMDDPSKSKVVGKIEFAPMPSARRKGEATLGAWLLGVPAASRRKELAGEFLRWATSPEAMKQAVLRGNPPTRRSVFEDADLKRRFRSFPAQLASLASARPRPRTPLWNEIEESFGIYLSMANAGGIGAEDAMRRSQSEIQAILERNR